MNRCKDCKWWEPYEERIKLVYERAIDMGECSNEKLEQSGSDCLNAGETFSSPCRPATGKDFGCIHWEAKEQCEHPLGFRVQKNDKWRCDKCGQEGSGDALA